MGEVEEDLNQLRRERDFFSGLLRLRDQKAPEALLSDALKLLVDAVQAKHGYIELTAELDAKDVRWNAAQGLTPEQLNSVQVACSRGIIGEALATHQTLHTASAFLDPRFSNFDSVRHNKIEAVLCAPIGTGAPIGIVYLEGAHEAGPFGLQALSLTKTFVDNLTPLCERLLAERKVEEPENCANLLPYPGLIAYSNSMRTVLSKLALAAPLDINILFSGPSGSGKSLLALAVHHNCDRSKGPLIEVNCAALPENLIENELFGSAPGGHSAAPAIGSEGRVGASENGTLFLDEIGELSLPAQAKLLQLLQSGTYFRLGDPAPRTANVRVLAASNSDLDDLVKQGRFREDLLYRLQVFKVAVPPLTHRKADLLPLAKHFFAEACARHGFDGLQLSPAATVAIQLADWPGNVRQLAHAIEAGAITAMVTDSEFVEPEHILPEDSPTGSIPKTQCSLQAQMHAIRAQIVNATLHDTDWNVSKTARRLDVARSHLYRLIQIHGIHRDQNELSRGQSD